MATTRVPSNHNDLKTQELIVYIADKMKDNPNYGKVMLNKVLYYIDNISFLRHGKTISSFTYVKQDLGPTPKPNQFMGVIDLLKRENRIEEVCFEKFGREQKRMVSKRKAVIDHFDPEEIELMDDVISKCGELTATEISDLSHTEMAWKIAERFEELPPFTYLLTKAEINEQDVNWAKDYLRRSRAVSSD